MKGLGRWPSFGGVGGGKGGNAKRFATLRLHKNLSLHKNRLKSITGFFSVDVNC